MDIVFCFKFTLEREIEGKKGGRDKERQRERERKREKERERGISKRDIGLENIIVFLNLQKRGRHREGV